jgi:Ca2+-binding RTX toxin-like protein
MILKVFPMPVLSTSRAILDSLDRIDALDNLDNIELQYEENIADALAALSGDWSFTTLSAALIEAEADGFTLRMTGAGLSPVSSAQDLEDAIDCGFASGALDKLAMLDGGTEILAFETISGGYRISTGSTHFDVTGTLLGTLEGMADLFDDAATLAGDLDALTEQARTDLVARLSAFEATGLGITHDGAQLVGLGETATGTRFELIGYAIDIDNTLPSNLGALTEALFALDALGPDPDWEVLYDTVQDLASFGALTLSDPDGAVRATMTAEDVDAALGEEEGFDFEVDGETFGDLLVDSAARAAGNDTFYSAADDVRALLLGFAGDDELFGGRLADVINGGRDDDFIDAGDGDDDVQGGTGEDFIYGWDGDDLLRGGRGEDSISGNAGDDVIRGQRNADELQGGAGEDNIKGGGGRDFLDGGADDDFLKGGTRQDTILGGDGDDRLFGNSFNDELSGGQGADTLNGGGGDDRLYGGAGDDRMKGGAGADLFEFDLGDEHDTIVDFDATQDSLRIYTATDIGTAQDLVDGALLDSGGLIFDFGMDGSVFLEGVTDTTGLADAIEIDLLVF